MAEENLKTYGEPEIETYTNKDVGKEWLKEKISRAKAGLKVKSDEFKAKMQVRADRQKEMNIKKAQAYNEEREKQYISNERYKAQLQSKVDRERLKQRYAPKKKAQLGIIGGKPSGNKHNLGGIGSSSYTGLFSGSKLSKRTISRGGGLMSGSSNYGCIFGHSKATIHKRKRYIKYKKKYR